MLRSKILNIAKVKYFFTLLSQHVFLAILAVDETILCRVVTDLHLKKLSYNEIREHIQLIYGLDLTKHHIHSILQKAGEKAIIVNKRLDHTIYSKIHTVEVDEVFQGKSHVILGVAEKKTQYLLALNPSLDRTATSISSFLAPLAKRCCNIRVVITDLYSAYKTVIPNLFKKARHLACHVHVQRDSLRRMDKLSFKCNRAKKELTRCERTLEKSRNKIIQLSTQKKGWEQKLVLDRQIREDLQTKKLQSKSRKTKTIDSRLATVRKRILRRSDALIVVKKQTDKVRSLRDRKRQEKRRFEKNYQKNQQSYLQSCRLQSIFFRLLKDTSREFPHNLQQFMLRLDGSKYRYATHLNKMIRTNPHIFSLRKPTDLAWNFQNSNTIERIFGILRPRLDATRLLRTPEGASSFCDLFRLYYNTTPRYTGIHNNICPYEQFGRNLGGKAYLDFLFPTRKRTSIFLGRTRSDRLKIGFSVRSVPHSAAVVCF